MNKRLISVLISLLCFTLVISPAYAESQSPSTSSSDKSLSDLKIDYKTMVGHENRTYDQLYQKFIDEGLSQDDSEYYTKIDIFVNQIEVQKINVEKDLKKAEKIDAKYSRLHPDEIREHALAKDANSLKTLLSQNAAMTLGFTDLKELSRSIDKQKDGFKVTIEYEDGSQFIQSSFTSKSEDQPESSDVVTNTTTPTHVTGPWNQSNQFASNTSITTSNTYISTSSWQYMSALGYAKVSDVYKWNYDATNCDTTYISDTGASAYSGIVTIGTEYLSNHQNTSAISVTQYIQGYTDVRFQVSSAFTASCAGLGINVSSGAGWHEYCITEVDNFGDVYNYAGQFM